MCGQFGNFGGCGVSNSCGTSGSGCALILVLFILLVIIGSTSLGRF